MKIKTYRGVLAKVNDAVGRGNVVNHEPTEENMLGQSGAHTLTDDIMNVIEEVRGEAFPADQAGIVYRGLVGFLQSLGEFQKDESQVFCVNCLKVGDKCQCK